MASIRMRNGTYQITVSCGNAFGKGEYPLRKALEERIIAKFANKLNNKRAYFH